MGQALKILVATANNDILSDQEIRDVLVPSVVSLAAAGVNVGDQIGLRLGKTLILPDSNTNIEEAADVVHGFASGRDTLVDKIVIGPGSLRAPVPTVATEIQVLFQVDPLDPSFAISGSQ